MTDRVLKETDRTGKVTERIVKMNDRAGKVTQRRISPQSDE
ncbi:hypothetical protein ACIQXF_22230 [Lysinibacillus sp. NPDC097231]